MSTPGPSGSELLFPDQPPVIQTPNLPTEMQKLDDLMMQFNKILQRLDNAPDPALLAAKAAENLYGVLQAQVTAMNPPTVTPAVAQPAAPVTPQVQAPPLVMPPPKFTAPLAPLDSAAGASPSLRSLFPDIEPACITAVIAHELKATDLYKLDTRVKDLEPSYSLSTTRKFATVSPHAAGNTPMFALPWAVVKNIH
ncbi:hypothetical protein B0H10DRAFT_2241117 [Mycena sp. CBHHK59/15]|nr:hypothetical protein B0H10DRAFT_2241117 [Mycena sp. CBHHK59/15]